MAEYYSRREMSLHGERIRDDEHVYGSRVRDDGRSNAEEFRSFSRSDDQGLYVSRVCDDGRSNAEEFRSFSRSDDQGLYVSRVCEDGRSNAEEFRSLSRSDDQGLGVRNLGTLSRFQWHCLPNGSRGASGSNSVNEDVHSNGFARRGPNYDTLVERPVPLVSEGIRNVPTYDTHIDDSRYFECERTRSVSRLPVEDGRNYSVREREYPQRQPVDEVGGLMFRPEDGSHSLTPRSQSSGQRTPSRGISRERLPQEGQYRSVEVPPTRLSSYYRIQSAEGVSPRARGEYASNVHRADGYVHPESHRSRDYSLTAVSEDTYDDGRRVLGYNDRESYGIDAVNAMLPSDHSVGNSRRDAVMEEGYSGLHDINRPLQEASALDNYDGSRIGYEFVYGELNICPKNSYPDHRTEEIRQSLPREGQFTYERNTRDMPYEQQYVYCTRPNDEILLRDENTQLILDARDCTSPEQSNSLKRRLVVVNETSGAKRIARAIRGASNYDERHLSAEDEDGLRLSNRLSHHHGESHSSAHTGVSIAEAGQPSNGLRRSRQKPLSKPVECNRGDVKKRLKFPEAVSRPCAPQLSWPKEAKRSKTSPRATNTVSSVKTCGKPKGTELKKKLNSEPKQVASPSTATDDVLKSGPNANKRQKNTSKDSGSMNEDLRPQDVDADQKVLKVKPLNDLPENSEKFKQTIDEWFFRCMVHLIIENISYRKKFKGQGIDCRLKCVICSSFKEFCEIKDVAAHAFASLKVGYRAQHLGFHRALCVLMGWDSAVAANGRWVCQSLPEPVAWTLREDVIIWPPVVIVQNFQGRNCQVNEVGKFSIELKNILKDKGFTREIRALHEKPGNPNIVVVEFQGTLPGLKEAERLHNSFAENKRGRAELAQLDAEVVYCKLVDKKPKDTQKLVDKSDDPYPVDKSEDEQEPVDRIKDEQYVHETEDYQKPIDKREDENEHMKIDEQLADKVENDQEPIGKDRDDLGSVDKARDDQVPLKEAQGDQEHVEEAQGEQKPVHKSLGDQELVEEAQAEQNPIGKSQGDQEQVNRTSDTQLTQGLTDNSKDDQEPLEKTGYDQEPVSLADNSKGGQALVEEAQGEQILLGKSKGYREQANKTSDTQGPTDNRNDDQEPLHKTGYDQAPVGLANNSKDYQKPLDKTAYDQEPTGQNGDDQKPVVKKYNTLYGYLGIVEDLPRLPNNIKRHHLARSKEERFASFNAAAI